MQVWTPRFPRPSETLITNGHRCINHWTLLAALIFSHVSTVIPFLGLAYRAGGLAPARMNLYYALQLCPEDRGSALFRYTSAALGCSLHCAPQGTGRPAAAYTVRPNRPFAFAGQLVRALDIVCHAPTMRMTPRSHQCRAASCSAHSKRLAASQPKPPYQGI